MSHFLRVQIERIQPDTIILRLPNDTTMTWPISKTGDSALDVQHLKTGQELILTLTQSIDVINELLENTHDQQKSKTS